MSEAVTPDVWWLSGTRGSNVFLARTADARFVLLDTGFASSADAVIAEVERLGVTAQLAAILVTHAHPDHYGAASALSARLGVPVAAGRADCVRTPDGGLLLRPPRIPHPVLGALRGGWFAATAPNTRVDIAIEGEVEVVPGIVAIPVPGHTPGSYCYLHVASDVAFVGDLVISHRDGLARPLRFTNSDDGLYLQTLATFAARAPGSGCAGHGAPVLDSFRERLQALAEQPRSRIGSGKAHLQRARRMLAFAAGISRARKPEVDVE